MDRLLPVDVFWFQRNGLRIAKPV